MMDEPNLTCDTGTAEDYVTEENKRLRAALKEAEDALWRLGMLADDDPMAQIKEALSSPVEKVVDGA